MPQNSPPTGSSDFFASTLHLDFPTPDQIESAYSDLPARGRVLVTSRFPELAGVLVALERTGFFGLRLAMPSKGAHAAQISAFKGKEGLCYDTGKSVTYAGGAAAALDDDGHLLFGTSRVCEKTAGIYASPIYADVLQVSEGDPQLLARLDGDPVVFDCDTFEADVERLASALGPEQKGEERRVPILYPGPLRLLVLADGSMLRRGQATLVRAEEAKLLGRRNEGVLLADKHAAGAIEPLSFVGGYREEGAIFLLGDLPLASTFEHADEIDMSALYRTPENMIAKLRKLVEREDKYLILTGSDPHDEFGCCPSDDVGAANRLVEAGVLDCWHPPSAPAACPSTVYAFRGEIAVAEKRPSFTIDREFRRTVTEYLTPAWKSGKKLPLTIARTSHRL